jgi:hypothetical protein
MVGRLIIGSNSICFGISFSGLAPVSCAAGTSYFRAANLKKGSRDCNFSAFSGQHSTWHATFFEHRPLPDMSIYSFSPHIYL